MTEAEELNSFNHRTKASSAICDYTTENAPYHPGNFTYPGPRGPGTNDIVISPLICFNIKMKQQQQQQIIRKEERNLKTVSLQ